MELVKPQFIPPLDDGFRPAVLANRAFERKVRDVGVPLVIGLERDAGKVTRFETRVFPENDPRAGENLYYVERLFKFLLWQRGGFKIYLGGPRSIAEYLQQAYSPGGARKFDAHFLGAQVYERSFSVESCAAENVPVAHEPGEPLGRHLDGCRIGFDLGASDRKVSAVVDGKVIYSEEVIWEPRKQSDPGYHYQEIMTALKNAAAKMERLDAIGGSSAGIFIDNRPMVASLFRGIHPDRFPEVRDLFQRIREEFNVPLVVINDGDVAALAGSMSLEDNGVLGIALGSSEAAGYIDLDGHILGWLNELAFAPLDYSPTAPADEWSGDIGCGSQYFSQQCVFRLAPKAGIRVPANITDAERLLSIQEKLEAGHEGAEQIWRSMGIYLGYALAHYADFYTIRHVLILGRCTSGRGGALLLEEANRVLAAEFPGLASRFHVQLPDERSRRIGQSIAAASLPSLS
ncbi:MAG TPA: ROK family protein [Anaerolineaceae bacterium]|nr:ROK family protein [Anaerolineaceae bacterium]